MAFSAFCFFPVSREIGCSLNYETRVTKKKQIIFAFHCCASEKKTRAENGKAMKPINLTKKETRSVTIAGEEAMREMQNAKPSFYLFTTLNPLQQFFFFRHFLLSKDEANKNLLKSRALFLADLIIFLLILTVKRSSRFVCSLSDKENCKRTVTPRQ